MNWIRRFHSFLWLRFFKSLDYSPGDFESDRLLADYIGAGKKWFLFALSCVTVTPFPFKPSGHNLAMSRNIVPLVGASAAFLVVRATASRIRAQVGLAHFINLALSFGGTAARHETNIPSRSCQLWKYDGGFSAQRENWSRDTIAAVRHH